MVMMVDDEVRLESEDWLCKCVCCWGWVEFFFYVRCIFLLFGVGVSCGL